ncbi:hypothetical protein KEJ18_06235 [Candidatus Bathyarchaeota archaeon]|nr:hypothetical protein [Candidatus Bathyarchaeota archaeon]
MGEEKTRIEDLIRRIDELTRILKFLLDDLSEISQSLKAGLSVVPQPLVSEPSRLLPQPKTSQQTITVSEPSPAPTPLGSIQSAEDVQRVFPQDLLSMLYFEEKDDQVIIKPRAFLGADNFRRIASIIRDQMNGEYVSAGKDSHFRIMKRA